MKGYQAKMLKKTTFESNSCIFLINYPAFVTIWLFINRVTQEAEGTKLHKEKKRKRNNWSYEPKIFLIARNISSTETLQYCLHSFSSNKVAVNFPLIRGMLCWISLLPATYFLSTSSIVEERRISTQDICPRERILLHRCHGYAHFVALMETQADSKWINLRSKKSKKSFNY